MNTATIRFLACTWFVGFCFWSGGQVALAEADSAALADAVQQREFASARALLAKHVDVNAPQADGMTALHWAVYHDQVQIVRLLLEAKADVEAQNRYGVRPLSLACKNGNAAIVQALLDAGADPETTLSGGETALMTAARTGRLAPVRLLVERGVDVNATERKGQTALMWAAADGHDAVVDYLLDAGADPHTALESGFNAMFFAVREGQADVVRRLLQAGMDVNAVMLVEDSRGGRPNKGTSALLLAVENGHFELARMLLEAGADVNNSRTGYTALHALTWVRKPIRGDGDPSPIGSGKLDSLSFAEELIARGADVNARHGKHQIGDLRLSKTDATPLLLAAETADIPLMRLLFKHGADPSLTNADNCTPLLVAAGVGVLSNGDESAGTEEEAIEAVRLLIEWGNDVNAVDDFGNTAMHGAAFKSRIELAQFLADNGADVRIWNQENVRGWTPLKIAEGYRPGNFRPSPETLAVITKLLQGQN